jgi:hypothetical protein
MKWKIDNSGMFAISEFEHKYINLLTVDELKKLKIESPDFLLISIFGKVIFAKDADEDDRGGFVAYGTLI